MAEGIVTIRRGREKPVINQHPWIFSGAIDTAQQATPGALVTVNDHQGQFLARGYWNPRSQIQVRILTWQDETIDDAWWQERFTRAIRARYPQGTNPTEANRLINAENDFLPGLIVDRYADVLVIQALTLYIDQYKAHLAALLAEICQSLGLTIRSVYERSDVDVRGKEGLKPHVGLLWGEEPPALINIIHDNKPRLVDIRQGHKTGYYLDQLANHTRLTQHIANIPDARMLNLFSYTGGFGLNTEAYVINVDASADALALAQQTYAHAGRPASLAEFVQADVFDYLRTVDKSPQFDVIICDPPKFAHNKQQIDRATRGYKDLNLNAFRLIKPGGYLFTFSCSGAITPDLFQKVVFGALADSGRQAQIIGQHGPASDHPVALSFPEGAYLKGLLLRVY